jgi:hypothetical protein
MITSAKERYVIARDANVVRVDFGRDPEPPVPRFPGAAGLRPASDDEPGWDALSFAEPVWMRAGA